MENMRLTTHNGRTTTAGEAYSPKHNDRNKIKADHIDRGKVTLTGTGIACKKTICG